MSLDELLEARLLGEALRVAESEHLRPYSEHLALYSEHLRGSSEHLGLEDEAHLLRLAPPVNDRAKRLKRRMMQYLLTGRIRVV